MGGLQLVPMYLSDRRDLLQQLHLSLEIALSTVVRVRRPWFDPEISFEPSRGQYNSTTLLRLLLDDPSDTGSRVLGITSADLFAPVLTYVFGEAQLDGRAAVVSIHRLRPEAYGLPSDNTLLLERLLKESVHELGHTFGLIHCLDATCVMHASTYVEDIDLKSAEFCAVCHASVTTGKEDLLG